MNRPRNQDGFTLVEIMMAMMILSVVLVSIAGLTFRTSQRAISNMTIDQRQSVMMMELNRLASVPDSAVATSVGCTSNMGVSTYKYQRCITTSTPTPSVTRIQLVITPNNAVWKPDTVFVDRTIAPFNPLCSAC